MMTRISRDADMSIVGDGSVGRKFDRRFAPRQQYRDPPYSLAKTILTRGCTGYDDSPELGPIDGNQLWRHRTPISRRDAACPVSTRGVLYAGMSSRYIWWKA